MKWKGRNESSRKTMRQEEIHVCDADHCVIYYTLGTLKNGIHKGELVSLQPRLSSMTENVNRWDVASQPLVQIVESYRVHTVAYPYQRLSLGLCRSSFQQGHRTGYRDPHSRKNLHHHKGIS
jgi:hypothetical protein